MIATRRPSLLRRMFLSKVVFPEPRNPERMVTGRRACLAAFIFWTCAWFFLACLCGWLRAFVGFRLENGMTVVCVGRSGGKERKRSQGCHGCRYRRLEPEVEEGQEPTGG